MKLLFKTQINKSVLEIKSKFNQDLFMALKPPLVGLKVERFDGCSVHDEIHLDIGSFGLKQQWVSVITEENQDDNEWSFVDEGKVIPWPLASWRHHHRVIRLNQDTSLIVDDITYECSLPGLSGIIYPAMWLSFAGRPKCYNVFFEESKLKLLFFTIIFLSLSLQAKTVLFLGDSLTEGYQLEKEEAFPYLIEKKLKPMHPDLKIINGGVSGATTASGLKRLNWYVKAKPDIIVIALGSNDGLRGTNLVESEKNLSGLIEKAQSENMKVILVGMKMPTNYGEPYRTQFEKMFPALAKKYKLNLVPFLLEGIGGNPKLNLADGIHPNTEGHKIMAKTILKVLEPLL